MALPVTGSYNRRQVALLLMTLSLGFASSDFPRICADLQPCYLLRFLVPNYYQLPAGLDLIYDERHDVHGFRFTSRASTLNFRAQSLFKYCDLFAEEFSILATFKAGKRSSSKEECIFALIPRGTTTIKIGVRLYKGRLHVDYYDRVLRMRKVTEFKDSRLVDGDWHTVILSVTGDMVSLRVDCGRAKRKRLKRRFPSLINVKSDNIHIGNFNQESKGVFSGMLKDLIFQPGGDLSLIACPSRDPGLPDLGITPEPHPPGSVWAGEERTCTWKDTGRLNFDVHDKTMRVCYSGVWQTVLESPVIDTQPKRMDYIVWHQDIVTAAPTIDIEIFRIADEGLFMATASFDGDDLRKQQSAIFKWEKNKFKFYQSLYTLGAQAWESFQIGKKYFLAVANTGGKRDKPSKSIIFLWSRKRKRFRVHQELVTWTARDLEYFEIEGRHYLAVANHVQGKNHTIDSEIFLWSETEEQFESAQHVTTIGAYDWTHFKLDGYHFLAVANSFSGSPADSTRLDSVIYFWQSGQFLPFQSLLTTGATDWEFFAIDEEFFLVVANAYNYGPHTTNLTERYVSNSTIYRLNAVQKRFEVYQQILTYSAVDWEYFKVGRDHYLIVSNAQHEGATTDDSEASEQRCHLAKTRSVIYRWQGVEKFVAVHYPDSLASADWETFTQGGDTYLVYANAKDSISQVYRVKPMS